MKKSSGSVQIVITIWFAALLMNTLFGTAILTSLFADAGMVGAYALVGFVFSAIFSVPVVLILFICLKLFVRLEISGRKLFLLFFFIGNVLTAATFLFFSSTDSASLLPTRSLFLVATVSSSLAMLLEYQPLVHLHKTADDPHFKTFLND